jgi:hypothetical protein
MTMITNTTIGSADITAPGFDADGIRGLAGRSVRPTA